MSQAQSNLYYWMVLLLGANLISGLPAAYLGHYIAYRRGYLKTGFIAGLLGGLPGAVCCLLLPAKEHPLLHTEGDLHYKARDENHEYWKLGSLLAIMGQLYWLFIILWVWFMLQQDDSPPEFVWHSNWWLICGVLVANYALAALVLVLRARPTMDLLPPLHETADSGMDELLRWISLRHRLAVLINAQVPRRIPMALGIPLAVVMTGVCLSFFSGEHNGSERLLVVLIWLATLGLSAFGVWFARRPNPALIATLREIHLAFREVEGYDGQLVMHAIELPGARGQAYLRQLDGQARALMGAQPGRRSVAESWRARSIAAATADTAAQTHHFAFGKPLAAAGAGLLIFKVISYAWKAERFGEYSYSQVVHGGNYYLWIVLPLVLLLALLLLIRWVQQRKRRK